MRVLAGILALSLLVSNASAAHICVSYAKKAINNRTCRGGHLMFHDMNADETVPDSFKLSARSKCTKSPQTCGSYGGHKCARKCIAHHLRGHIYCPLDYHDPLRHGHNSQHDWCSACPDHGNRKKHGHFILRFRSFRDRQHRSRWQFSKFLRSYSVIQIYD